ncbi:MAG: nuclear transport factor 2 family protein [Solirubrobacteraceae bacterium]
MSEENVEAYRRSVDAWTRDDREAWLQEIPPDWEFVSSGVFLGLDPAYRGPEGALKLWEDMRGPWSDFEVTIERIEELGEETIALVTFQVRGRDDLRTSRRWAHVTTFRGGVPIRIENYASWDEALKAVGLAE